MRARRPRPWLPGLFVLIVPVLATSAGNYAATATTTNGGADYVNFAMAFKRATTAAVTHAVLMTA